VDPEATEAVPAGWYPDPFGHLPYRWWDGEQWSAYALGAEVEWDPLPIQGPVTSRLPGLPSMGVALTSFALGVGFSYAVLALLRVEGKPGGVGAELVLSELALWAGLIGACLWVSRRRGQSSLARDFALRIRPIDIGFGLAGSIAARSTESVAILPVTAFHPYFRAPDESVFHEFLAGSWGWVLLALVTCVGAPIVEELFFRGLVQTRLVGRVGPVLGIGITSVLFGAAHLIGWVGPLTLVYALAVAGGGVALGTIRHITGRLGTSMIAHSLFNAQALLALALLSSTSFKI
jgi:membrane protease YdiL (CAAX protease family)